jgi:peroxiredoxin Q/BCP
LAELVGVDQKVPKFKATDVFGSKVNLSKYDNDYTLLVFLRYSGCPWCNLAIHRLTLEYKQLRAERCQIIAFIQSDEKSVMANIYKRHNPKPEFPIIADQTMKFYKQFNVDVSLTGSARMITKVPYWLESVRQLGFKNKKVDGKLFLVPAWFLIDNSLGKIIKSEKGGDFYDHESFIKIYDTLTFGEE